MPFDAGSVVGKLELGIEGWKKSVETVKKDQESLAGFAIRHKDAIQNLGKAFTVAGAAITGALGAAVAATANYGDKINDLSQRTGVATEILSGYKLAADNSGTSIDGLATGFKFLSQRMVDVEQGGKDSIAMFKDMGVEVLNADGSLRDSNAVMLDVAQRFSEMEDGAQKTALAVDVFGRSGMELIPMLNMGKQGLKDNYEAAERFGGVISKEAAAACDLFNDKLGNMKAALGGATREIGMALMPSVQSLVEQITKAAVKFREWVKEHGPVVEMATKMTAAMGGTSIAVGGLLLAFAKFAPILGGLAGAWGASTPAMTGFIGVAVAATGAVITLIGTLFELKAAEEYAVEAGNRSAEANRNLIGTLMDAATKAGMSAGAFADLVVAHNANAIAVKNAIFHDEKYAAIKKVLTDSSNAYQEKIRKEAEETAKTALAALHAKEAAEALKKANEEYAAFLNSIGIFTQKQYGAELIKLEKAERDAIAARVDGRLSAEQFANAIKALTDEGKKYGIALNTQILPASRNLADVFKAAPNQLASVTWGFNTLEAAVADCANQMGMSINTARAMAYEMARLALALQGIHMPDMRIPGDQKVQVQQDVLDFKHYWDGFFNEVSQKWSDTIGDFIKGNTSIVTAWNRLWKNMGDTILDFIAKIIVEKLVKALEGIFTTTKKATDEAGGAFTSMGTTIANVATSIGSVITTLAGALLDVIELIAKTVVDIVAYAIETLAESIATAAKSLAAAAPDLLIVGAIALALYAGFSAIKALFASGGGGAGDGMGRVVERQDRFLAMFDSWHLDILDIAVYCQGRLDVIVDRLDWIGGLLAGHVTDAINSVAGAISEWGSNLAGGLNDIAGAIKGIPGAATGAMVTSPTLLRVGEEAPRIPEVIIPLPELGKWASGLPPASSGQGSGPVTQSGTRAGTIVNLKIYAQTLDDNTISRAAEKIKKALDWEDRRYGRAGT